MSYFLRFLKLRYLIFGSLGTGAYVANEKIEDLKEYTDLSRFQKYLPNNDKLNQLKESTLIFAENTRNIAKNQYLNFSQWRNSLQESLEEKLKYQLQSESIEDGATKSMRAESSSSNSFDSSLILDGLQKEINSLKEKTTSQIETLEKENVELRKQLLLRQSRNAGRSPTIKKSLIDMYSEVLDELSDFESNSVNKPQTSYLRDNLPRVVVVGDQSAGKTSVLEMIAKARIFPRGGGEMMTRSPVKVTLSEGPYHIANFKDSDRTYDLSQESELVDLRREIETRMRNSTKNSTVSSEIISLSVQGPGLHRMVLVDLPGVISTVTREMNENTKEAIHKMVQHHMSNPNAIILCVQDGSIDAERSIVTDLVSSMDPHGKRTIFVLTKMDLAESNSASPDRIRKILDGKLFPMKALGYFGVVTGRGNKNDSINSILKYESDFFQNSKLLSSGAMRTSQTTTSNLSRAVSEKFWQLVRDSAEQQADVFKAIRYNLETEWKNTFPNVREQDREELFERSRNEILDNLVALSSLPAHIWEQAFYDELWKHFRDFIFNEVCVPAAQLTDEGSYQTFVDIRLRQWLDKELPKLTVQIAQQILYDQLREIQIKQSKSNLSNKQADLFLPLQNFVFEAALKQHSWDAKANSSLHVIQIAALEQRTFTARAQWNQALEFMRESVKFKIKNEAKVIKGLEGPGRVEQWLYWHKKSAVQKNRSALIGELQKLLAAFPQHSFDLLPDELTTIRRNLHVRKLEIDNEFIRETWTHVYYKHFFDDMLQRCKECESSFYLHQQGFTGAGFPNCRDVSLFWRLRNLLQSSSTALRHQVMSTEINNLERIMKEVLDQAYFNSSLMKELITGHQVQLAEDLKRVRNIQERLEEFVKALKFDRNRN